LNPRVGLFSHFLFFIFHFLKYVDFRFSINILNN
jgi:hypothetical protein